MPPTFEVGNDWGSQVRWQMQSDSESMNFALYTLQFQNWGGIGTAWVPHAVVLVNVVLLYMSERCPSGKC